MKSDSLKIRLSNVVATLVAFVTVASLAHAQGEFAVAPTDSKVSSSNIVPLLDAKSEQARAGFFTRGDVRDVFGTQLEQTKQPTLRYFNQKRDRPADLSGAVGPEASKVPAVPTSREAILQQFGDPSVPVPVRAIENAPLPFKGLIAAVEAGDDELAFQYAKQYSRYMEGVRRTSARAVSLTGLAMEGQGYVEEGGWTGAPQLYEDRALLEKDLSREKGNRNRGENPGAVTAVDAKVRALVERAKQETLSEGNLLAEADQRKVEAIDRKTIREARLGKVPVDPSGRVDVYWFFTPESAESQKMAAEIQKLHAQGDKQLTVLGVTMKPVADQELQKFASAHGITFPLRNASNLTRSLGVKRAPTTAFIGQQSGKAYFEQGVLSFVAVDEIARMARGK